ncbi:MAG: hypothetical protein B6I36_01680 [Desulfobacteraceae bacterium 4572_35.1]|nr:MAG: hypothetical protein B6I36_01680 [Desulfobacteraceae bacterium 4572_35.1]
MKNLYQRLFAIVVIPLLLVACQSEEGAKVVPESPAVIQEKEKAAVDLKMSREFLEKVADKKEQPLLAMPPERLEKDSAKLREIEVSPGVLLDPQQEGLVEKVEGGEVKITVPFD